MEKKSIIIFGKGPSVLKCTRDFVDQFEDIAICGYPVLNDFFYNLIKDRKINYHFCNCGSFDPRYTNRINKKLQIEGIYNTNKPPNNYQKFLKKCTLFKDLDRDKYFNYFSKDLNFGKYGASTGLICFKYILDTIKYDKIALVGFDNFKKGDQTYYFTPKDYGPEAKRVINLKYKNNVIIKPNGIYNQISLHDPEKSRQFIENTFNQNKDIKFYVISNENFTESDNLFFK